MLNTHQLHAPEASHAQRGDELQVLQGGGGGEVRELLLQTPLLHLLRAGVTQQRRLRPDGGQRMTESVREIVKDR